MLQIGDVLGNEYELDQSWVEAVDAVGLYDRMAALGTHIQQVRVVGGYGQSATAGARPTAFQNQFNEGQH